MGKFRNLCDEIIVDLECVTYEGDISDVGNEIGYVLANYIGDYDEEGAWDLDAFIAGVRHGISLKDGTHG
jgi:hypothetical protein